jgi:predicted DNA-binding WGR domain protein
MEQQLDLFPVAAHLRRVDPDQNMRRFYRLGLQPDLFGGCTLIREWGRIGSGGRMRCDNHPSEGQAVSALIAMAKAKAKRGYASIG